MFTLCFQWNCEKDGVWWFHQQLKGSESPQYTRSVPSSSITESALITFLYQTWFPESAITNTKMTINAILTHAFYSLPVYVGRSEFCLSSVCSYFLTWAEYKCHQPCSFTFLVTLQRPMIFHWIVYISLWSTMVSSVTICSLSPLLSLLLSFSFPRSNALDGF